jgi:HK97 family phage major capsid protein
VASIDASGLIPTSISAEITTEVIQQSIALQLGRVIPIPAGVTVIPVPMSFPVAGWVTAPGGSKPWTEFDIGSTQLQAEELAAMIAIPDVYVEDSVINLWNYARPLLSQALSLALDMAVIWGTNAPASFPVGGIDAIALPVGAGADQVATYNAMMAEVEKQGLVPNGSVSDIAVQAALRGVRDTVGAFIFGYNQADQGAKTTLFGDPILFQTFPATATSDSYTGDWDKLVIGVRDDIRFELTSEGVITDGAGKVLVSAFQDNVTIMKVWARYGAAILQPATLKVPQGGSIPFAKSTVGTGALMRGGGEQQAQSERGGAGPGTPKAKSA